MIFPLGKMEAKKNDRMMRQLPMKSHFIEMGESRTEGLPPSSYRALAYTVVTII